MAPFPTDVSAAVALSVAPSDAAQRSARRRSNGLIIVSSPLQEAPSERLFEHPEINYADLGAQQPRRPYRAWRQVARVERQKSHRPAAGLSLL
jgi:hypothetical protein